MRAPPRDPTVLCRLQGLGPRSRGPGSGHGFTGIPPCPQVLIRRGRVPIVSLECVSCKAQAVYAVSRSSYVYLEGRCVNCSGGSKRGVSGRGRGRGRAGSRGRGRSAPQRPVCVSAPQRWAARTFSNQTLVLDETTTSTGSSGMQLVVRRGVLQDGEGYTFTLTVLGRSGEEEGCASIRLSANRPPRGGSCRLFPLDAVRALTTKVHFECTGELRAGRWGGAAPGPQGLGPRLTL